MNGMSGWRPMLANVAVVSVVSLLLWFWAAGQTRETAAVSVTMRIAPSDPERATIVPGDAFSVELELQGSRRDLERATDRLGGKTIVLKSGRPGIPSLPGSYVLDLTNALVRADELTTLGVAAISATPASVSIDILETVTVDAKVLVTIPGVQLAGETVAEPQTVRVTLAKSLASGLGTEPHVEAFLPTAQANTLPAGRRHSLDVGLRVPEALTKEASLVRITPDRARITFTLQSRSSTAVLRLVPVQVAGPPADLDGFSVSINRDDEFLRDVEVSGPSETIRALEEGRLKALAFVHLSADDLALRLARKRIDLWLLPPGVTVNRIGESTDTSPVVRFAVQERGKSQR